MKFQAGFLLANTLVMIVFMFIFPVPTILRWIFLGVVAGAFLVIGLGYLVFIKNINS